MNRSKVRDVAGQSAMTITVVGSYVKASYRNDNGEPT